MQVSRELKEAYEEKRALGFMTSLLKGRNPQAVKSDLLQAVNGRKREFYFHVKLPTASGRWLKGYVQITGPFTVMVTPSEDGSGHKRSIAYEDIRLSPRNPLMKKLMDMEMISSPYGACLEDDTTNGENAASSTHEEQHVSMLASAMEPIEIPSKDVGNKAQCQISTRPEDPSFEKLTSIKQQELQRARDIFG